jgi:hypothetical protein
MSAPTTNRAFPPSRARYAMAALCTLLSACIGRGPRTLPGYIASADTFRQEYGRYHGRSAPGVELADQFQLAAQSTAAAKYAEAVSVLDTLSRKAPLPVVFNDLGVLYAQLDDRGHAVNAFREALAIDLTYQPVRFNINRLRGFTSNEADPVTREIEPNGNANSANAISLGKAVEAEISAGQGDEDYFRFHAPPEPRDIISLEIVNNSQTLAPMAAIFTEDLRQQNWGKAVREPGASLTVQFSPEPNAVLYVQVRGYGFTAGKYTLTLRPLRAFDAYEPDDTIFTAHHLEIGREIEANIMDGRDTDYYSFTAPRDGAVHVEIRNRSATLVPALATFHPDMRASGFGPDVRTAGDSLKYDMPVASGKTYYIQVWPLRNSSGAYSLAVR